MGITAGPDGNLWFAESLKDRIGRITPAGQVTEFSAGITPAAAPAEVTTGPDGNLWFTELGGSRIGRITPAGTVTEFAAGVASGSAPSGITAGPDGNLWFTEFGANQIGRLATPGIVPAAMTTSLASSEPSVEAGRRVPLTATVASGAGTPGGIVTFRDGNTVINAATVDTKKQAVYLIERAETTLAKVDLSPATDDLEVVAKALARVDDQVRRLTDDIAAMQKQKKK